MMPVSIHTYRACVCVCVCERERERERERQRQTEIRRDTGREIHKGQRDTLTQVGCRVLCV